MCTRMSNGSFTSAEALLDLNRACLFLILMVMEEDLEGGYVANQNVIRASNP